MIEIREIRSDEHDALARVLDERLGFERDESGDRELEPGRTLWSFAIDLRPHPAEP